MKKLLLLLAGLLFAVLPTSAQIYQVSQDGIKTAEELTTGDYLIYAIPDGTAKKSGYVNYSETGADSRHYLTSPLEIVSGLVSNPNYIWTVTKTTEGSFEFVLKSDPTIYWIDDTKWGQNMTSSTEKAVLTAENSEEGIKFKPAEEMNTNEDVLATDTYLNCNGPINTNYNSLSYWGGSTGAATFVFYKVTESDETEMPAYPFELSDAPTSEGFAKNTTWYYMTLRDGFVTYDQTQNYCPAGATTNPITYGSFWAFVETADGQIEIYNAAAGPQYVLASSSPINDGDNGGNTFPTLQEKASLDATTNGTWNIKYTIGDSFFFLSRPNEDQSFINSRNGKLSFWVHANSSNDDGSKLQAQKIDLNATIEQVKNTNTIPDGAVGSLTDASHSDFTAALEKGSMEGLIEALKIRDLTGETVKLDPDKLYRLRNVMRGGILQINAEKKLVKEDAVNNSNATELWKIIPVENAEDKVKLLNINAQLSATGTNNATVTEEGTEYTQKNWGSGQFSFHNGSYLVQYGDGNIGGWSSVAKNGDGMWYIMPAENIDVTITEAGYATVNYPFAVQVPAGVTAYTGTLSADKKVFNLNEIKNGIIPANTPVVLQGAADTYSLTILAGNTDEPLANNKLSGINLSKTFETTTNAYILGNVNEEVGFYLMNETDRTLGANKAYIELEAATAQGIRSIVIGGPTTGIEETVAESTEAEEYYDLQGRRVMNPTKGIYVTKSGKKVLFNK